MRDANRTVGGFVLTLALVSGFARTSLPHYSFSQVGRAEGVLGSSAVDDGAQEPDVLRQLRIRYRK